MTNDSTREYTLANHLINSDGDLQSLPMGSVVVGGSGGVFEKSSERYSDGTSFWFQTGHDDATAGDPDLPALLVYLPEDQKSTAD
ncbi:hypothetical protein F8O07_06735 [Pseudoclavibacter sp. CFCC 13796]|uniref:hypothetical protein n=1 Tax=Pseudoclavibacter sp. CFCC 13796 TaxID=2615179 RepID=UPI0013010270|nr:hypothetical protein [Pseudoclavibacter sp. CFCC 13796]KAB1661595.1 hypothetical protein F8O07_06735 [Pseudoclavibacter sp. CFCC 13796]